MYSHLPTVELPKILVVDDSKDIHRLSGHILRSLGTVVHAFNGHDGIAIAMAEKPDLILLDYEMPDLDGLTVLKRLKSEPTLEVIPVIMVTSVPESKLIAETFAQGAIDYVRKPILESEMQARVKSALRMQSLIRTLENAANLDSLTELLNRSAFCNQLKMALARHNTSESPLAVMFIDLDQFKIVNDSFGHEIGDQLIKQVAGRLATVLQSVPVQKQIESGALARTGGDEFLVMLEGLAHADDAKTIAQAFIDALSEEYVLESHRLYSSCSIGISFASDPTRSSMQDTSEELIRNADIAMYEAKKTGRGRQRVFDQRMHSRRERRLEIETELRDAMHRKDFHLVYQPIVHLQTDCIESVEALIRWDHPERGVVSPAEFIPIAEETGLIDDIGTWCLQTALQEFAMWRRIANRNAPNSISVNIARQQLLRPKFFEHVLEITRVAKVDPKRVHLEITETGIMEMPQESIEVMKAFRSAGFKIDLDDFGTGYSSLACISQFPIDVIKIDRSIIQNIATDPSSAKLVHFVLRLAEETMVTVVAEGIEEREQADLLKLWGCDFGQGFLIGRPMPGESILAFANRYSLFRSEPRIKPRRILDI